MAERNSRLVLNTRGEDVATLQAQLQKLGYTLPKHETDAQVLGVATRDALRDFQNAHSLPRSGALDERTQLALENAVAAAEAQSHSLQGRILLDDGTPAENLRLRLYHRGLGDSASLLVEGNVGVGGYYALEYTPPGRATTANLELRGTRCRRQRGESVLHQVQRGQARGHGPGSASERRGAGPQNSSD